MWGTWGRLRSVIHCIHLVNKLFHLLRARVVKYFLKIARKAKGPLRLENAVVSYFKDSQGVGRRRAFLPPKEAKVRPVQPRSKPAAKSPKSTVQKAALFCLNVNSLHCKSFHDIAFVFASRLFTKPGFGQTQPGHCWTYVGADDGFRGPVPRWFCWANDTACWWHLEDRSRPEACLHPAILKLISSRKLLNLSLSIKPVSDLHCSTKWYIVKFKRGVQCLLATDSFTAKKIRTSII